MTMKMVVTSMVQVTPLRRLRVSSP